MNWFLGSSGSKKKPSFNHFFDLSSPSKSSDLLGSKPMTILGDRVTKKQRSFLDPSSRLSSSRFSDFDGDGVINGLDCAPRNRYRHAFKLPDKIRKFYGKHCHGTCGEAAHDVVVAARKQGVPEDKIKVHGYSIEHPTRGGVTNHMVAEVEGTFIDPTAPQLGHDKVVTTYPVYGPNSRPMDMRNYEKSDSYLFETRGDFIKKMSDRRKHLSDQS